MPAGRGARYGLPGNGEESGNGQAGRAGPGGMSARSLNGFDLNLVKVFLAIWDTRSLTLAGERLGLTQPAVSHALKRLREQFSDPLFLRVGNLMEPTDAATRLHEPFDRVLHILGQSVLDHDGFDPASSRRTFRVAMSDVSEMFCLPPVLAFLEQVAPGVRMVSVQLVAETIVGELRTGQVDLALGYLPDLVAGETLPSPLLTDRFVCVVSSRHPLAGQALTPDLFSRLTFIDVAMRATGYRRVEAELARRGIERQVVARLEHVTVIPAIVRQTGYAALFPLSAARQIVADGGVALLDLPLDLPEIDIALHGHANFRKDPGIQWLRSAITGVLCPGPEP
ncbi:LysR family transcriptional regulator [Segnochrobactraceae bacterium EtOH-i3]